MQNYEHLGKPLQIGRLTIKNRFCMAPIGGGQHHLPGGGLKDETIQYLIERAKGGFGLIFTGAIAADGTVDPYTGVGPTILQNPDAFKMTATELNERAGAYGTKIFAQITMGLGRNYPNLPAPSSVHVFRHPGVVSPELTIDQIKSKIESVVKASKIAKDSGFSGVEVHSIHWGYLLDQFALSMMNHRTDEYGGSLENRLRAAKEILEGIKQECGSDFPVSMRLGLKTFVKGFEQASLTGEEEMGRTLEEGVEIAKLLESYGYDCLNVDTGIYDSFYYACPPMYMPKGYLVELAAKAKEAVNIPILAGGRMNEADIAENAIRDGKIDAVVLGRTALADPEYPNKVLTGHTEKIRPCIACNQGCITRLQQGKQPTCAVNPVAMREVRYVLRPCVQPKKVVVVGGGAAGMEAARTAAMRGHKVFLYEKNGSLGGNLIPGGSHSFKKEVRELNAWYQNELKALPVEIHTGETVTSEQLRNMDADVIILATGSVPVMPNVPGMDDKKVLGCMEAFAHPEKVGQKVMVIGGGLVGCEMALDYAQDGKEVMVAEALPKILSAGILSPIPNGQMIPDLFEHHHVTVLEKHRLSAVEDGKVILESDGQKKVLDADTVVIAVGFRPAPSMAQELQGCGAVVYEIGDGQKVSTILHAVWDGYEVGNNI
ncbi:FAD-dependent oxidoreductase [Schaedlerella arabinosiphila]|uniref:FAD-dependent oxidoreductase n=1 Tax=Schaedlerella arabinosiphila TaxID=2044587 RepID=A0A426DG73_9FIRM|nr:FAD-dependent oxidoreductase [Schaedlerella arabinosiphila]RRK31867.1 FAD-dependent oxidoreductase [Schaedlerella arabinosiphila]